MNYEFISIIKEKVNDDSTFIIIKLNRPKSKNALSTKLRDELVHVLQCITENNSLKLAVLMGNGSCFSAGFDLKEAISTNLNSFDYNFRDFFDAIYLFPKPLITVVHGFAFAGGFDLALAGDIITAADGTKFGHLEVRFGVTPLLSPLWKRVGISKAFEIASLGKPLQASEALQIGLINHLFPSENFMDKSLEIARELAKRPLQMLLDLKKVKQSIPYMDYTQSTDLELSLFRQLAGNKEIINNLKSYIKKMGENNL